MQDTFRKIWEMETGPYHRWNLVPNTTTAAAYSFTTQTIELSDVTKDDFAAALLGNLALQRKINVLLIHELRHWLDHISSLWGQQILRAGYNSLHARIANRADELWRVMMYRQRLRDSRFEEYYTTIENPSDPTGRGRWKYQFSAGARFDRSGRVDEQHPILFTRFRWSDDTICCRVPF